MMTSNQAIGFLSTTLQEQAYPSSYLSELLRYLGLNFSEPVELSTQQLKSLEEVLSALREQVPVEYIVGEALFCEHRFNISRDVLIPRFDTEILVEKTVELVNRLDTPITLLDIGTGSGAIIISLAKVLSNFVNVNFVAIDISAAALAIAKENAEKLGVADRITFQLADSYPTDAQNSPSIPQTQTVVIVSNPPYISPANFKQLPKSVIHYEPHLSLQENKEILTNIVSYCKLLEKQKKTIYFSLEYSNEEGNVQFYFLTPSTWKSALNSLIKRAS